MYGKINEHHRGGPNASKTDPARIVCPRAGVFHISAEASFTPPSTVTVDFHSPVHQWVTVRATGAARLSGEKLGS